MTVINTNINSLICLNNLRLTNLALSKTFQRLSTGLRINRAADDPSGLAIAEGMQAQISGMKTAVQNAEDGVNLMHTADSALAETQDILMRMRDLAVRASNEATLTSADLVRLNNEFSSLKAEIQRKSQAVTFNTKLLFDGSYSGGAANGRLLQIGADNGTVYRLTINIPNLGLSNLGLSMAGGSAANQATINNVISAQLAIDQVQSAINRISDVRADIGIQERRVYHIIDDLEAAQINISAARSRIMDADMASEISELTRLMILQQTGMAILAQANMMPATILQLMLK